MPPSRALRYSLACRTSRLERIGAIARIRYKKGGNVAGSLVAAGQEESQWLCPIKDRRGLDSARSRIEAFCPRSSALTEHGIPPALLCAPYRHEDPSRIPPKFLHSDDCTHLNRGIRSVRMRFRIDGDEAVRRVGWLSSRKSRFISSRRRTVPCNDASSWPLQPRRL
jgi:hypothetical protein